MTIVPSRKQVAAITQLARLLRKQVAAITQLAQLLLSPSANQRSKRKWWKQNESIIRRHDKNSMPSDIARTRLSNGYVFEKNVLRPEDREYMIDLFKLHSRTLNKPVNYYVPLIDGKMAVIIRSLVDLYLQEIKDYLGPSLRMDYYYFMETSSRAHKSVSSSWHTDNVGRRIKMYITLQSDGKTPTAYIAGSNRKPYRMPIVGQLRFFGVKDYRKKRGEKLIRHETGSVALLDTNGLHRGVYEASQFQRLCFVVEFIDSEKADRLVGRNLPVGPGRIAPQDDPTRFTDEAVAMLSDLLDKKLLHNFDDGIQVYDVKRPSQEEFAEMGR